MYKMVNEELRIQSCSIEDLSQEIKESFVEQFKGDPIETLTLFYNPINDTVILNQDNKDYEVYELTAELYLNDNKEIRKQIKENVTSGIKETLTLLDAVIHRRHEVEMENMAKELRKILGQQDMKPFTDNVALLKELRKVDVEHNEPGGIFFEYNAFMYGYIQGIRAERARRKKVSV